MQLTPVNSSVGLIEASDVDSEPLYYRLEPATVRTYLMSWCGHTGQDAEEIPNCMCCTFSYLSIEENANINILTI